MRHPFQHTLTKVVIMARTSTPDLINHVLKNSVSADDDVKFPVTPSKDMVFGQEAFVTEPFTSNNSKTGSQFLGSIYLPTLAAGAALDIIVVVGDYNILMKDILNEFESAGLSTQWFRDPVYTGGTAQTIYNYNDENANPQDFSIIAGATVSSAGTPVGPQVHSLGTTSLGNRGVVRETFAAGVERVLWKNSVYMYRIINEDTTGPTRLVTTATWYQGPLTIELYD